jgi:hypothetical protein
MMMISQVVKLKFNLFISIKNLDDDVVVDLESQKFRIFEVKLLNSIQSELKHQTNCRCRMSVDQILFKSARNVFYEFFEFGIYKQSKASL